MEGSLTPPKANILGQYTTSEGINRGSLCLERGHSSTQMLEAREWEVGDRASSFIPIVKQDPSSKVQLFCKLWSPGDH